MVRFLVRAGVVGAGERGAEFHLEDCLEPDGCLDAYPSSSYRARSTDFVGISPRGEGFQGRGSPPPPSPRNGCYACNPHSKTFGLLKLRTSRPSHPARPPASSLAPSHLRCSNSVPDGTSFFGAHAPALEPVAPRPRGRGQSWRYSHGPLYRAAGNEQPSLFSGIQIK